MDKTLQHKILAAVIAAGTLGLYTANPVNAENYYTVEKEGDIITGDYDIILGNEHNFTFDNGSVSIVLGAGNLDGTASSNGSTIYIGQNAEIGSIRGGFSQNAVSGNTIYFNGTVHQDIYGGYSIAGPASENTVILNGTLGETSQIYGGFSIAGDAVKNNIISNNTTIYNKVYGGISDTGNTVGNSVTINEGSAGIIYGGFSNNGNAVGNSVTINDSTIKGYIYGGYTETSGDAIGNNVTINNGTIEYNEIYGGYSHNGIAEGNTVEINSGTLNSRFIYGGYGTSDNDDYFTANKTEANNNQVIIKEAVITSSTLNIFGGYAKGNTNNNLVLIEGDHSIYGIYGGISENGNSNNNAIIIKGKVNSSYISAGNSNNGNTDNNLVFISNNSSTRLAAGGIASNGTANNNIVFITDSNAREIYGGITENSSDDYDSTVNADYNTVIINNSETGSVAGGYTNNGTATNNLVSISDSDTHGDIYGGRSINGDAENNIIIISKTDAASGRIAGGRSRTGNAEGNTVLISDDSTISGRIYGGRSSEGDVNGNTVLINNSTLLDNVYGGGSSEGNANGNIVIINDSKLPNIVFGGYSDEGNTNDNIVIISNNVYDPNETTTTNVYGGNAEKGSAERNIVQITGGKTELVYGGHSGLGKAKDNIVTINGGEVSNVYGGTSNNGSSSNNKVYIKDGTILHIIAGFSTNYEKINNVENNSVYISGGKITGDVNGGITNKGNAIGNNVIISDGNITGDVYGGISENGNADNNNVVINGGKITGWVYGGRSNNGTATNNNIIISGNADITKAYLFGSNIINSNINLYESNVNNNNTGNTLTIDDWSDSTQSVQNFNDIAFKNIAWNEDEPVLTITKGNTGDLENTTIDTIHIAGGSDINVDESKTLIESGNGNDLGLTEGNVTDTFTAGVAREGLGSTSVNGNVVTFNIDSVKLSSQAVSAAQTRAASAAFVNQGTDLISDSLDTISRDDNYGVKTFAAVHGNRSKYDVADDIKINGWSTIVGVGNADKFDNGSELSWGVFYENGSGNYRTYNSFNNEFFRGDGSMVYNGGGIAARYENKNGVYTEGSLRAGMLKNELDNAMRDVNGSYGYETESAYYGAHIGVGKIISLSDSSDLDIYGKFFHTYTEGDSVTIADDKFDFDSITSDRLRIGARITSNKENKFSTYYGLAYEYEFNGDADMTAQGLRADTQSLQGSSVMAEVGFNYQPTLDSPWSIDLNMRGYTGERQGGSFNVQATYTF